MRDAGGDIKKERVAHRSRECETKRVCRQLTVYPLCPLCPVRYGFQARCSCYFVIAAVLRSVNSALYCASYFKML